MCGMPLPGASGANRTVSQPMVHPTTRPITGSTAHPESGCWWADASTREPRPVYGVDGVAEEYGETAGEQADEGGAGEVGRRAVFEPLRSRRPPVTIRSMSVP